MNVWKVPFIADETRAKGAMRQHFHHSHKEVRAKRFTDSTSTYMKTIVRMLEQCFDRYFTTINAAEKKKLDYAVTK